MLITDLFLIFCCCYTSVRPPRERAKLKIKLKFGYSRSRVCSGIILLDGSEGVDGWMDEWINLELSGTGMADDVINGKGGENRKPSSSTLPPPPMMMIRKDHAQIYLEAILH